MLDPHGILVFLDDHLLNLWDFQAMLDPGEIWVFLDDQFVESLGFPRNFGSAWNLGIFGRSSF